MLKCNKIKVGDSVIYNSETKTVIAICLSSVMLTELSFDELDRLSKEDLNEHLKVRYETWIDLDEITLI